MTKIKGKKRNVERRKNYESGRFGNRKKKGGNYSWFERKMVMMHLISDRMIAFLCRSSTNGVQALRWRIKHNYLNLYN